MRVKRTAEIDRDGVADALLRMNTTRAKVVRDWTEGRSIVDVNRTLRLQLYQTEDIIREMHRAKVERLKAQVARLEKLVALSTPPPVTGVESTDRRTWVTLVNIPNISTNLSWAAVVHRALCNAKVTVGAVRNVQGDQDHTAIKVPKAQRQQAERILDQLVQWYLDHIKQHGTCTQAHLDLVPTYTQEAPRDKA